MTGSIAQTQVVKKIEQNIDDNLEFLKMFKDGLNCNDLPEVLLEADDDGCHDDQGTLYNTSNGTGVNFLK